MAGVFRWELRQPLAEGIAILIAEGDAIDVEIVVRRDGLAEGWTLPVPGIVFFSSRAER